MRGAGQPDQPQRPSRGSTHTWQIATGSTTMAQASIAILRDFPTATPRLIKAEEPQPPSTEPTSASI